MYIYLTTNKINGKKYIGLSTRDSKKSLTYLGSGVNLTKAIKKYGRENFQKKILEDNILTFEKLCRREEFYIKKYNAVNSKSFYNAEKGGISTSFWNSANEDQCKKAKKKISKSVKKYFSNSKITEQTIEKQKRSAFLTYEKRYKLEFKMYDEFLKKRKFNMFLKYRRKSSYKIWIRDNSDVRVEISKVGKKKTRNSTIKEIYKFSMNGVLFFMEMKSLITSNMKPDFQRFPKSLEQY